MICQSDIRQGQRCIVLFNFVNMTQIVGMTTRRERLEGGAHQRECLFLSTKRTMWAIGLHWLSLSLSLSVVRQSDGGCTLYRYDWTWCIWQRDVYMIWCGRWVRTNGKCVISSDGSKIKLWWVMSHNLKWCYIYDRFMMWSTRCTVILYFSGSWRRSMGQNDDTSYDIIIIHHHDE